MVNSRGGLDSSLFFRRWIFYSRDDDGSLAHPSYRGHTHGKLVWKLTPTKSLKQKFSFNVNKKSSTREPNEPITSKNSNIYVEN